MEKEKSTAESNLAYVQFGNRWYAVTKDQAWNLSLAGYKTAKVPPDPNNVDEPVNLISRESQK